MQTCVVVTGPPCSGKSTLARRLAARFARPLLAKDDYKDAVFHHLGARDRAWSRRVSDLAWDLLFAEAERLCATGASCVLEGNFRAEHGPRLAALVDLAPRGLALAEVRCRAEARVLAQRFVARAGLRHPGHADGEWVQAGLDGLGLDRAPAPLGLDAAGFDYDTTGGGEPEALERAVADWLAAVAPADGTHARAS